MNTAWQDLIDRQEGFINFTPELHAAVGRSKVALIGAGGNGSVVDLLVRAGFQRLILVEPDYVDGTNLNRLPFARADIGLPKVEAWRRYLHGINPDCAIEAHQKPVTRHDGPWLKEILAGVSLIFLGTTEVEANLVVGRIASEMGIRMIIGPASSGSSIVSTFTHDNGLDVETLGNFGTRGTALPDIDYQAMQALYAKAMAFPGRKNNYDPETWRKMTAGQISARSCGMLVRLTNAVTALEAIKNIAVLNGLPLVRTKVVAMPEVQVFDPWSGCSYRFNARTGAIGIPAWPDGEIQWMKPSA